MRSGSRSSRSVATGSVTRSGGREDGDVLVLIGGLPGVGTTTVAREVARRTRGAHVRIDALEAGLVDLGLAPPGGVGAAGYGLPLTVADTLLAGGAPVIADAVFPVAESRPRWPRRGAVERSARAGLPGLGRGDRPGRGRLGRAAHRRRHRGRRPRGRR